MDRQILDVQGIRTQTILGDDDLQMRVFPAEFGNKASSGVELAIVRGGAVLPPDKFWTEWKYYLASR